MSLFSPATVIVQGITGAHGSFHTGAMLNYGTNIIAGTSPTKAGSIVHGVPVYARINDISEAHGTIEASVIFVPSVAAKAAIMEAIDAHIPLIACITEGIPVHDMLAIHTRLNESKSVLVGPNSPGIFTPGVAKLGIIPAAITSPGRVGVVSRSGTLTYEVVALLTRAGIGQRSIVGIGGDQLRGYSFVDCLREFDTMSDVDAIVMIGEIGGRGELAAAEYIATSKLQTPIIGYITGQSAPKGVQLGHAGAILGSDDESAVTKTHALAEAGVTMCQSLGDILPALQARLVY